MCHFHTCSPLHCRDSCLPPVPSSYQALAPEPLPCPCGPPISLIFPRCTQLCLHVSGQHLPTQVSALRPLLRGPPSAAVPITVLYIRLLRLLKSPSMFVCLPVCHASSPSGTSPVGQGPSPSCSALCPPRLVHVWRPEAQGEGTSDDPLLCTKLMGSSDFCPEVTFFGHRTSSFKAFDRQH